MDQWREEVGGGQTDADEASAEARTIPRDACRHRGVAVRTRARACMRVHRLLCERGSSHTHMHAHMDGTPTCVRACVSVCTRVHGIYLKTDAGERRHADRCIASRRERGSALMHTCTAEYMRACSHRSQRANMHERVHAHAQRRIHACTHPHSACCRGLGDLKAETGTKDLQEEVAESHDLRFLIVAVFVCHAQKGGGAGASRPVGRRTRRSRSPHAVPPRSRTYAGNVSDLQRPRRASSSSAAVTCSQWAREGGKRAMARHRDSVPPLAAATHMSKRLAPAIVDRDASFLFRLVKKSWAHM